MKIREDTVVRNKAIYLPLGVPSDGTRDILGIWIENTEGAKSRLKVFSDLRTRGVNDVRIAATELDPFEAGAWARSCQPSRRRGVAPGTA